MPALPEGMKSLPVGNAAEVSIKQKNASACVD
jgi:hypothetical protein